MCLCAHLYAHLNDRDLYFWDVSNVSDVPDYDTEDTKTPQKMLETTIGFLCLYFHPNGKWLITCEV